MSSPPSALSPLYPGSLNPPRKRPMINTAGPSNVKRRKASAVSAVSSAHPLRQTSFPPPEADFASRASSYSPPIDGSLTGVSSTTGAGRKRKSVRGKPGAEARSQTGGSITGTKAGSAGGRGSLVNGTGQDIGDEEEAEDEDEDGIVDTILEGGTLPDEAQLKLERQNLRMLIEAFSGDQADRYDMWRRVRLNKATVRRLVNQTLSQSVPASIVTTVSGYTKLFIGELIERARDVQAEWLASTPTLPTGDPNPYFPGAYNAIGTIKTRIKDETQSSGDTQVATQSSGITQHSQDQSFDVKEMDKGPLTPDHLREALRRYKRDREGGGAGFHGLSQYGRTNTASRNGGRRLFR